MAPSTLKFAEKKPYFLIVARDICYHQSPPSDHPDWSDQWCWYFNVNNNGTTEEVKSYLYPQQHEALMEQGAGKGAKVKMQYNGKNPGATQPKWVIEVAPGFNGSPVEVRESSFGGDGGGKSNGNGRQQPQQQQSQQQAPDGWPVDDNSGPPPGWDDAPAAPEAEAPPPEEEKPNYPETKVVDLPGEMLESAFWALRMFEHPTFPRLMDRLMKVYGNQPPDDALPLELFVEWYKAVATSLFIERNRKGMTDIKDAFRIVSAPPLE